MCADTRELRGDVKLCQEFLLTSTSTSSTLVRWPKEPSRESLGTSRVLPRSWRPACPNTQFGRLAPSFRTRSYFNISKYWSKLVEIHVRYKQDMENSGPEFQVINIWSIHRYFCDLVLLQDCDLSKGDQTLLFTILLYRQNAQSKLYLLPRMVLVIVISQSWDMSLISQSVPAFVKSSIDDD